MKQLNRLCLILIAAVLGGILAQPSQAQDPRGRPEPPAQPRPPVRRSRTPRAPGPLTVILTVMTNPPHSEVYLNGQKRGTTGEDGKIQFERIPLGNYQVEVRKQGYVTAFKGFDAGYESPTLVFKLAPDIGPVSKEFDALIEANRLIGPESPNALELVSDLSGRYGDAAEVAHMRGVLGARLMDLTGPTVGRVYAKWREVTAAELESARGAAVAAAELLPSDRRASASAEYFKALAAWRDWQTAPPKAADPSESMPSEHPGTTGRAVTNQEALVAVRDGFERASQLDDSWAPPVYHLGLTLLALGDLSRAEAAFIQARKLDPAWPMAHAGLGSAYYAQGKHKEAVEAYNRAVELDPRNAYAHAGLGLALASGGDKKDGIKKVERAVELDPLSALPHLNLGLIHSQSNRRDDIDKAIESLRMAVKLNAPGLEFRNREAEEMITVLQTRRRR